MTQSSNDLVVVYQSSDIVSASVSVSCLEQAGIPYMTRNRDCENLIGAGTFGTGFNVAAGPFELLVRADRAGEAREALDELLAADAEKLRTRPYEEFREVTTPRQIVNVLVWFMIIAVVTGSLGYIGNIALAAALFLLGMMTLTIGYGYWRRMRTLGYEWAEIGDANWILLRCRGRALRLPPAADVETIPGGTQDSEGVIDFLNALAIYKRRRREESR
ncbi:MAG: DUF2007 domain-containing protein [Candidatus Sumerlaeia bacterium]